MTWDFWVLKCVQSEQFDVCLRLPLNSFHSVRIEDWASFSCVQYIGGTIYSSLTPIPSSLSSHSTVFVGWFFRISHSGFGGSGNSILMERHSGASIVFYWGFVCLFIWSCSIFTLQDNSLYPPTPCWSPLIYLFPSTLPCGSIEANLRWSPGALAAEVSVLLPV